WPVHRAVCWGAGVAAALATVVGPLAEAAHRDFVAHMWAHLLIGMLAPLLLVLSAPVTLALRTLSAVPARRLAALLRSVPMQVLAHPVPAALLSAGGLWVLYRTPLLQAMQSDPLVHLLVHAHLLAAGFLFTAAVIGLDPAPHRPDRRLVTVVLVLAAASHAILARSLVAAPPAGVPVAEAEAGAELMYTAGGWVEAAVIVIFCLRWYRAAGRRLVPA
ncbi:MAG TPA: cytochrome c oxidase assembly protein, partial [Rhodoglobus sp.]|nr:cytochrome c oxidase assembly protein [Rhodoglobus sp.]